MLVQTSIPVRFCHIPTYCHTHITAIYATAPSPSGDHVRVRVLSVHTLAGRSKVAIVQTRPGYESWPVWAFSLTNISAFVNQEVQ